MNQKVVIGGAWPYANGSLHIGHIAGLLPGDVIARYHRALGNDVYYVSGSDCHGTPVCIRAKQEGKTPQEVSDGYHEEFSECFKKLGFSYDYYGKTSQREHKEFVQNFHEKLYDSEYVYEKTVPQAYCETCHTFLADRFVIGKCPVCGETTRGDQCDACGTVLDPEELVEPHCFVCNSVPVFKETKHLYIAITKLKEKLQKLVNEHPNWRKNAIALSNRYLNEGLCDRALTRDLDWGIDVPKEGYEGKKIYIWAENVLGYLSMSSIVAKQRNVAFEELWGDTARHYYVHAKDNIPFHTIILPALLLAEGENFHLPDEIISNEYQTLEGRKISTSQNWAIWIKDIVDTYNPDAIRYFFLANGPEKRDTDFSWNEFVNSNNGELVGAYGNFINRTLVFIHKYFDGKVPEGTFDQHWEQKLNVLYEKVGSCIDHGNLKEGLELVFEEVRNANKYYDQQAPWTTRTTDPAQCADTIYNCTQLVLNFAKLLQPYLPFSSNEVLNWFGCRADWKLELAAEGYQVPDTKILFERIPKERIEEEKSKMKK